jgi:hypothetical protein
VLIEHQGGHPQAHGVVGMVEQRDHRGRDPTGRPDIPVRVLDDSARVTRLLPVSLEDCAPVLDRCVDNAAMTA